MSETDSGPGLPLDGHLALRPGFRLQYETAQECEVLLFPEGMITLSGSAGAILKHCDGTRSAAGIVTALQQQFPEAELREDVMEFLNVAWGKGWLCEA